MRCIGLAGQFSIFIVPAQADTTGRATVIDADTIEIRGERIRLDGIDAPESSQTCEADGSFAAPPSQACPRFPPLRLVRRLPTEAKRRSLPAHDRRPTTLHKSRHW